MQTSSRSWPCTASATSPHSSASFRIRRRRASAASRWVSGPCLRSARRFVGCPGQPNHASRDPSVVRPPVCPRYPGSRAQPVSSPHLPDWHPPRSVTARSLSTNSGASDSEARGATHEVRTQLGCLSTSPSTSTRASISRFKFPEHGSDERPLSLPRIPSDWNACTLTGSAERCCCATPLPTRTRRARSKLDDCSTALHQSILTSAIFKGPRATVSWPGVPGRHRFVAPQ
ncbi:hypothetical protein OH77DRAFT_67703 [Trametes cingulata]|nr:hypothetical protein OH77DRAFT_67703 [Trametes cingulata]